MNAEAFLAPRSAFGDALYQLCQENPRIVVLCADLRESLRIEKIATDLPGQFIEVGVAEQNMMGIAAGLALAGKIPFVTSFAAFNPGRNWDQLRVSVAYAQANVKIIGGHAGLSVGPDGATHQALEDIAITRVIPNLSVVTPSDAYQTALATRAIAEHQGPVYMRFGRSEQQVLPAKTRAEQSFIVGKALVRRTGTDVTICAIGVMLQVALAAAEEIQKSHGIRATVIDMGTVKPLDHQAILKSAQKSRRVVTLEDHQMSGGLGGAVAELLSSVFPVPLLRLGVPDHFGESGKPEELYRKFGLDPAHVAQSVIRFVHAHS
jgi:transketolase